MANATFNIDTNFGEWDLSPLHEAPVTKATDKALVIAVGGPNDVTYTFAGTGFTYDGDGVTGGTCMRLTIRFGADVKVDISGINQPITALRDFADTNDVAGFQNLIFGGDDKFFVNTAGENVLNGYGGNDKFYFGGNFNSNSAVDGGDGTDALILDGAYGGGLFLSASQLSHVESVSVVAGNDYTLFFNDANIAAGTMLTVNGKTLGASDALNIDASHETDGTVKLIGGAGDDSLFGGNGADQLIAGAGANFLKGGPGADKIACGDGPDIVVYHTTTANHEGDESNANGFDTVTGFDTASDLIDVATKAIAYDGMIHASKLSKLALPGLAVDHAVIVEFNNGSTFLVVNSDGVAGYQAGSDLVVNFSAATNLAGFSEDNFFVFF